MSCKHENFAANVTVVRIEDRGLFVAKVEVSCTQCSLPFQFVGPEMGMSYTEPRVSVDRRELHAPIAPDIAEGVARAAGAPSYKVTMPQQGNVH